MAHDPLLQSSRCQPTGGRQVPSASERCKQRGSNIAKTLLAACMSLTAVTRPNLIGQFPGTNGFTMIVDDRVTLSSRL